MSQSYPGAPMREHAVFHPMERPHADTWRFRPEAKQRAKIASRSNGSLLLLLLLLLRSLQILRSLLQKRRPITGQSELVFHFRHRIGRRSEERRVGKGV